MSSIPTWDQFMAPSLRVLSDGEIHRARAVCNAAADELGVPEEQRAELIRLITIQGCSYIAQPVG